jgi:hypothetical protein
MGGKIGIVQQQGGMSNVNLWGGLWDASEIPLIGLL